jgi:hypothetical protein
MYESWKPSSQEEHKWTNLDFKFGPSWGSNRMWKKVVIDGNGKIVKFTIRCYICCSILLNSVLTQHYNYKKCTNSVHFKSKQSTLTTLEDEPVNLRHCNKFLRKEQEKLSWNQFPWFLLTKHSVPVICSLYVMNWLKQFKRVIAALEKKLNRIYNILKHLG